MSIKGDLDFISCDIPYFSVRQETLDTLYISYIQPEIDLFFKPRNIVNPLKLDTDKIISLRDFSNSVSKTQVRFDYFYKELLNHIKKEKGKPIDLKPRYCISLDLENTPHTCEATKRKYGVIELNNTPVLYYIHFDFIEILDEIKKIPHISPQIYNSEKKRFI